MLVAESALFYLVAGGSEYLSGAMTGISGIWMLRFIQLQSS